MKVTEVQAVGGDTLVMVLLGGVALLLLIALVGDRVREIPLPWGNVKLDPKTRRRTARAVARVLDAEAASFAARALRDRSLITPHALETQNLGHVRLLGLALGEAAEPELVLRANKLDAAQATTATAHAIEDAGALLHVAAEAPEAVTKLADQWKFTPDDIEKLRRGELTDNALDKIAAVAVDRVRESSASQG